jgi:hypothetical protein
VKKGFHHKFPAVKRMQWKIKSDKNYEAEFTLKGLKIAVKIDSTGKWIETGQQLYGSRLLPWFKIPLPSVLRGTKLLRSRLYNGGTTSSTRFGRYIWKTQKKS